MQLTQKQKTQGWRVVKFGEVAQEVRSSSKDPLAEGLERYVSLEHLDPESLKLARYGLIAEDTPTFTKRFSAGHTLFGRLRAYLHQVAIAEFDGICTGELIVLAPKGEDILPGLLPFIAQSERFIDWAVKHASGSTLPRTKFKALTEYEFALPPLPRQQELIALFTALDRSIEAAHQLARSTFQTRLSLISHHIHQAPNLREVKLGDVIECLNHKRTRIIDVRRSEKQGPYPYWGATGVLDHIDEYAYDEATVLIAADAGPFNEYYRRPIAHIARGKYWVSDHAHVLKPTNQITLDFLYFSLVHKNVIGFVNWGPIPRLNSKDMLRMPIKLPDRNTQQTITKPLTQTLTLEAQAKQQAAKILQIKKQAFQQLFEGETE